MSGRVSAPSESDAVLLGDLAADGLDARVGGHVEIGGRRFQVTGIVDGHGTLAGMMAALALPTLQELLAYLGLSCVLLASMGVGLALLPDHRRATLASAVLSAPFALYEIVFIPDSWAPTMMVRHYVGVEDVLFSFGSGGVAWLIPAAVFRRSVVLCWHPVKFLRRFVGGAGLGVVTSLALWGLGLSIMQSVLLCIIVGLGVPGTIGPCTLNVDETPAPGLAGCRSGAGRRVARRPLTLARVGRYPVDAIDHTDRI